MTKTVHIATGYGYLEDSSGAVVSKFDVPPGDHEFPDDVTVREVADAAELAAVAEPDQTPEPDPQREQLKQNYRDARANNNPQVQRDALFELLTGEQP